jgi:hypothetical protein
VNPATFFNSPRNSVFVLLGNIVPSFLMELSTLANVATDDQPYLDFLSGYSVFNIGRRSRFSAALRGKTALNTRPFSE